MIGGDDGGDLVQYRVAADLLLRRGYAVEVAGDCHSACTVLVDELAAAGQACMRPGGRLNVHRAAVGVPDGPPRVRPPVAYTPALTAAIEARGGQPTDGWLTLTPDDLAGIVPRC